MSSSMGSTLVGSAVKNERIMGQKLMCYGALAERRVAIGAVSTLSAQERQNGHAILQGDIGIIGAEPNKALTESGDSGAIWVDFAGMAVCMHHVLMTTFDEGDNNLVISRESYGVPMQRIVDAHASLGGQSTMAAQGVRVESYAPSAGATSEATTWVEVSRDIGHCEVMLRDDAAGHICTSYQIGFIPVSIRR